MGISRRAFLLAVRLLFDGARGVVEDSVIVPQPTIEGLKVFPVPVGGIVRAFPCPSVEEVGYLWRGDIGGLAPGAEGQDKTLQNITLLPVCGADIQCLRFIQILLHQVKQV